MLIQVPQTLQGLKNATVRRWFKQVGQAVKAGEVLVELEGEDALIQLQAPADGVLAAIEAEVGMTLSAGGELGTFSTGSTPAASSAPGGAAASPPAPQGVPIPMPQAGNSMEEGTILKWRVKVGDTVAVGQVICEVETDKATVEVEATAAGKIAWLAAEGSVVPVKQPIVMLGDALGVPPLGGNSSIASAAGGAREVSGSNPPKGGTPNLDAGTPIMMPQAGNTMEEGTLLKWRVKVGDAVAVGQVICEVETDKATIEVEATAAGKIAWLAAEGAVIPVKQPIVLLGDAPIAAPSAAVAAVAAPAKKEMAREAGLVAVASVAAMPKRAATGENGRVKASPAARKLAAERGIHLADVASGSGPGGRILSTDLTHAKAKAPAAAKPQPAASAASAGREIAPAGPMGALSGGRKPLSKMRKAIAVNLQTSKQTVPHFYVKLTINADPLFAFYRAQKPATGCTLNDVILLAVGRVVGEFAAFRSRLDGNDIVETPSANIGVAVSVPDGLVVPVLLGVHGLTLAQLAGESKKIVESARAGKIENMGKGVFTISNMGMLGVEDFSAIINPPESGILAISAVREDVLVRDGAMRAGRVMSMTLSVDHRVVDGALAAQWMGRLRELLENPEKLIN